MSKVLALAALAAGFWSTAAGATRWVGEGRAVPRIGVLLDFDSIPSKSSIQVMQREVAAALAATGAQVSWLTGKKGSQLETFDELAVLRFRGSCRMEKFEQPGIPETRRITLGATHLGSGGVSPYSSVECDQIKTCISGLLETSCARDRETAFGRALARVVAHELYHILAKTTEHTRNGISKALQTSFDLIRENFQFDRMALAKLRQRLFSAAGGNLAVDR